MLDFLASPTHLSTVSSILRTRLVLKGWALHFRRMTVSQQSCRNGTFRASLGGVWVVCWVVCLPFDRRAPPRNPNLNPSPNPNPNPHPPILEIRVRVKVRVRVRPTATLPWAGDLGVWSGCRCRYGNGTPYISVSQVSALRTSNAFKVYSKTRNKSAFWSSVY